MTNHSDTSTKVNAKYYRHMDVEQCFDVIPAKQLSSTERQAFWALFGFARKELNDPQCMEAWPAQDKLAQRMGAHRETVGKAIASLETKGLVTVERGGLMRGHEKQSSHYKLNIETLYMMARSFMAENESSAWFPVSKNPTRTVSKNPTRTGRKLRHGPVEKSDTNYSSKTTHQNNEPSSTTQEEQEEVVSGACGVVDESIVDEQLPFGAHNGEEEDFVGSDDADDQDALAPFTAVSRTREEEAPAVPAPKKSTTKAKSITKVRTVGPTHSWSIYTPDFKPVLAEACAQLGADERTASLRSMDVESLHAWFTMEQYARLCANMANIMVGASCDLISSCADTIAMSGDAPTQDHVRITNRLTALVESRAKRAATA